jgi:hypothetical protein
MIKSRRMRWKGHVTWMVEGRSVYRVLVGRPEVKRPLGRPRRRWEDNIKIYLGDIGIDGANWIEMAQDRVQWLALKVLSDSLLLKHVAKINHIDLSGNGLVMLDEGGELL